MYIYLDMCIYVGSHTHQPDLTHYIYMCIYMYMFTTHVHVHLHVYVHAHVCDRQFHLYMCLYASMQTYASTCMYVCM